MNNFLFTPSQEHVEPLRILAPDGQLNADFAPMDDDEALTAFELMLLTRIFDEKATSLQRQGRFGTFSSVRGQEGSVVGAASALDPRHDWVVPQYRELPALLRQGLPLENYALYFMGHPAGGAIPDDVNVLPIQISLAAQLPHAVGLAWGLRKQGSDSAVLTFLGDGASSEGDFHEALNLAGVMRAPAVFFLQNNGWAISTPRSTQSAARTFAERGPGYGVEGIYVDGNDLFAVHSVVSRAVERARAGDGPTLIESLTWRAGPHNTADDPTKYVTKEHHTPWEGSDPIDRMRAYLTSRELIDEASEAEAKDRCVAAVQSAMTAAQEMPSPTVDSIFDHVHGQESERFRSQRDALLAHEGAK